MRFPRFLRDQDWHDPVLNVDQFRFGLLIAPFIYLQYRRQCRNDILFIVIRVAQIRAVKIGQIQFRFTKFDAKTGNDLRGNQGEFFPGQLQHIIGKQLGWIGWSEIQFNGMQDQLYGFQQFFTILGFVKQRDDHLNGSFPDQPQTPVMPVFLK